MKKIILAANSSWYLLNFRSSSIIKLINSGYKVICLAPFDSHTEALKNLNSIKQNYPVLISVSNKSFIGKILGKENPIDRLFGSISAEVVSVFSSLSPKPS